MSKYEAYPFLCERSLRCDYEVLTDEYASEVGELYALMPEQYKPEIKFICELIYHLNPASRQPNSVTQEDFDRLLEICRKHENVVPPYFVLPLSGRVEAARCQVLRSKAKSIVRLLYRLKYEEDIEVDGIVWDCFNVMSQIFFEYALETTDEIERFVSRVY